jgi:hypothetical protein
MMISFPSENAHDERIRIVRPPNARRQRIADEVIR